MTTTDLIDTHWLRERLKGDKTIWMVTFLLALISIASVYSSVFAEALKRSEGNTMPYLLKHSGHVVAGLLLMYFTHLVDYKRIAAFARIGIFIVVPLLIYAWQYGDEIDQAARWLKIPFFNISFQPSDLARIFLVTYLARYLSTMQSTITELQPKQLLWPLIAIGGISGLVAANNVSTGLILIATSMLLMVIGRVPMRLLFTSGLVIMVLGTGFLVAGNRFQTAKNRVIRMFEAPPSVAERLKDDNQYQIVQGLIAIAGGGYFGQGPGGSTQKVKLPKPQNDFIFSVIVEEYGIVGGLFVVFLFLTLLWRGTIAVSNSRNPFAGLLSAGLSLNIFMQAVAHILVNTDMGPVTGQPLPLISMGGTSMITMYMSLGIILNISRENQEELDRTAKLGVA